MSNAHRIRSIFDSDIAQTLDRLETLLATPETPEFDTALKTQVAALLSWGEVLGIDELVGLAQSTVLLMRAAPDQNPITAQLALEGFRAIYRLELLQEQQPMLPEAIAASQPPLTAVPAEVNSELILEQRLTTTNLFIWQMDSMIFVLPSNQVIEILISKPENLLQTAREKCLLWRDQTIPIYQLGRKAGSVQPFPELDLTSVAETPLKSGTLLVVNQETHTLALDIDIKLLITDSELVILPFATGITPPGYCQGYTMRSGDQAVPVVNIAALLEQKLHRAPVLTAAAPATVPDPVQPATSQVLVVDDSHTLRHILSLTLEGAGYDVVQAQDGAEALEKLQRHREIRLVICDVEMPNMNGFDFLSHCRRDPELTGLPVVMLSTYTGDEHRQLSKTLGANAYFSKPYDQTEFLEKLQTLIA